MRGLGPRQLNSLVCEGLDPFWILSRGVALAPIQEFVKIIFANTDSKYGFCYNLYQFVKPRYLKILN
jgi:hypothetical protein